MERICIILLTIITFMVRVGKVTAEHKIIYPLLSQQSAKENELCLIITECKSLLALYNVSYRNLENFNICGFDRKKKLPMYKCPTKKDSIVLSIYSKKSQPNSVCNCKIVDKSYECNPSL